MDRINIKTDREYLREILGKIDKGQFAIPVFQRDFIWQKSQVIDLFDSLSKGYPIGSIILWKPDFPMSRAKDIISDEIIEPANPEYYVLDGRQRLTTFFGCIKNDENKDDIFKLCYDLDDMSFMYSKKESPKILRVSDLYDTFIMLSKLQALMNSDLEESDKKKYIERARQMNALLQSYTIGEIMMNDCSLENASTAFARINSKGTTISPLFMLQALTYSNDDGVLIGKEIEQILDSLAPYGFDTINTSFILNCFYQYVGKNSYDDKLEDLANSDFTEYMCNIKQDILKTVKFLYDECHVISSKLLPYGRQFELICSFFRRNPHPEECDLKELRKWFFYTSYQQVFMNSSLSVVRYVFKRFDAFVRHESETAYDYKPIELSQNLDNRFSLSSAKIDFLMLVEINHYLSLSNTTATVYTGYKKLLSETKPQYVVLYVSPMDKIDLQDAIDKKDDRRLVKYSLTAKMIETLFDRNAQKEFSQMREKFLIDLQFKFLKSLGFCFVEN